MGSVSLKVRSRLREGLCETLHVRWDDLCRSPGDTSRPEAQLNLRIGRAARTALDLVCIRYGINRSTVINVAPLLFLIMAERSLIERSRRLEELEERTAEAQDVIDNGLSHLGLAVRVTHKEETNPLEQERASIAARDVYGEKVHYEVSTAAAALPAALQTSLLEHNCVYEPLHPLLEAGATIEHLYRRRDGSEIGIVTVTRYLCGY
jgi:Flp pilus assembly protein TadB